MPVTIVYLRRPFSWLKFAQLVFGMVCFGLYMHYWTEITPYIIRGSDSSDESFVRNTFATTAFVGYPFVIVLSICITLCITGDSLENNVLCFILNFIGFGMYLTTGAIIAHNANESGADDPVKAIAAMSIITSFFFLCDIVIYLLQKCKK
ncbi:hypothetical protein CHUAL_009709 [Chamberlinius hualienensis]